MNSNRHIALRGRRVRAADEREAGFVLQSGVGRNERVGRDNAQPHWAFLSSERLTRHCH